MKSLEFLRNHLIDVLDIAKESISIRIEKGNSIFYLTNSAASANSNFQISYQGKIFVRNFAGSPESLIFLCNEWLKEKQPNLLNIRLSFEIDILSSEAIDILLIIDGMADTIYAEKGEDGFRLRTKDNAVIDPVLFMGAK